MSTIEIDILDALRQFDTPTICNVIELFDVRPRNRGYMDGRIRAAYTALPPMVGFAATATFRAAAPPRTGDAYANVAKQIARFGELSGPPVIVFQDLDDPPAAATFGEIMCTTYQAFGAVGLITSGTGRDLDQVERLDFPVFTNGTVCAHGYTHIPDIHVPVQVGGIGVYPNDLLHGDLNGVTTIPLDIAPEIPDVAAEYVAAEGLILSALSDDQRSATVYQEALAEAELQIGRLRAKVTRA